MGSRIPRQVTLSTRSVLILLNIQILVVFALAWPSLQHSVQTASLPTESSTPSISPTTRLEIPTLASTPTLSEPLETPTIDRFPLITPENTLPRGWLVLSMDDGANSHLFAYHPQRLSLTRLTNHPWDDLHPAINPDGTTIAYTSRQNGYWDLYLLNLVSGEIRQVTDTAEYEGSPSWSPDGTWMAFEAYTGDNLEISILSVTDPGQPPIPLTQDPASDSQPAWSPFPGRKIAFVSNRAGENDIWIADLDATDNRFLNLTPLTGSEQKHPTWSPDGAYLAWSSVQSGISTIYVWDSRDPQSRPRAVGNGDWPVWSPGGEMILTGVESPNQWHLTGYEAGSGNLLLPAVELEGDLHGLSWYAGDFPASIAEQVAAAAAVTPTPLWQATLTPPGEGPSVRYSVIELPEVSAPYPYLHDEANEAFEALRYRLAQEMGWDFLSSLENAYLPLTETLPPGYTEDWLYTGRAFAFNPVAMNAGWVAVVREDFGGKTYWRVYLKARYQDGSQGMPIDRPVWDLNARYNGDPSAYEQGGKLSATVPAGYWIDLTNLANRYGWERLPALVNWRTFFPGTHFNEFVLTGGLDWQTALLQLYPQEALLTATSPALPTRTPTRTPVGYWTKVPTETPAPTTTPTRRPTWTPLAP